MEARKIMGGSIDYISKDHIRPRLQEFIDIIDGYGLIKVLADDNGEDVHQDYVQQTVDGVKVQTVIGKNYRVNLFEDDSIEVTFSVRNTTYEKVQEFKDTMKEMGFKNRTSHKNNFGVTVKSTVIIDTEKDSEDIVKLFSLFDIK